jgi:signal transduction histidine kinase
VNLAAVAIENAQLFRHLTQTSEDYRTLREYHEKILSGLPLGEVVVSPNRSLEYMNQFAMRLWDLNPGEGIGQQFDNFFPIENGARETILALWQKHQEENVEVEGEVILDDKTYQVSFYNVKWWDHQDTHSGLLLLDISLQKLFDSEILNSDKRETVVQLAGGIAHEVNNLLLTITGRAELLQFRIGQIAGELSKNIGGDFKVIFNQAKKLQKVAEDLRRLSKPSTPKFVPTDVGQCVSTAVDVLSSTSGRIKKFNTTNPNAAFYLNMEIEPDLPFIEGDPQSLEQMFINLIINAADAIKNNKKGKLLLKVFKTNKDIIAKVEDTGIGIPANAVDKVFEPYYTTKGNKHGTGLGMSIVRRTVDIHRASIDLESEEGKGTIITITFPIKKKKTSKTLDAILT